MKTAFHSGSNFGLVAGLAAGIVGVSLTAGRADAPMADPNVVAQTGNVQLTAKDVRDLLSGLNAQQQQSFHQDPALLKKTLGSLMLQQLVLRQARAIGYDQQPAVIAQIKQLRDNALVQSYLESISQPPADFPTAAEVQGVYNSNRANLLLPRQYRLAQIFIACPANADTSTAGVARAKLNGVQKSLGQSATDFAAIARTVSDDRQSGAQGGEIGWLTESQIQPELRKEVSNLGKGAVSSPIRLPDGWHLLKVLDLKEASTPTLDEARPQLVARLRAMKAQANSQAYLAQLLRQNPISINEAALAGLQQKGPE